MYGKPTASLSSGLLARKGHARPAMRPQGFVSPSSQDDLGWNDLGEEPLQQQYPQPQAQPGPHPIEDEAPVEAPAPPVLRQRAELEEHIAPKPVPEPLPPEPQPEPVAAKPAVAKASVVTVGTLARVAREAGSAKFKAAFTLRLDHDRHLRLRLASAVRNRSAQQLVTEALDAFLESLTEVDALARQIADQGGRRSGE